MSSGQRTVPASQTRERSFRSRSTIITCSAASFSDARSSAAAPRGRVPLIGIVRIRSPRRARKSSGEAETTAQSPLTKGSGCSGRSGKASASARGFPANGAWRCWTTLTWYTSPRAIASRTSSIASRYRPALHVRSHSPIASGPPRIGSTALGSGATRSERERGTGLGWGAAGGGASDRLREPVAEVDIGDELLRARAKKPRVRSHSSMRSNAPPARGSRAAPQACASSVRSTSSPIGRRGDRRSRRSRCRRRAGPLRRPGRHEPSPG